MKLSVHLLMDRLVAEAGSTRPRELLVPDFGIRVAANSLYLPSIGLDQEWFRALAHDGLVRGMTASHAVQVDSRLPLDELLAELRERYTSTRYRDHVPLLDIISAVPSRQNVVAQLDLTLKHRVRAGLHIGPGRLDESKFPLRGFMTAELRHRGEFYVLAEGRWFLVDRAHLAHLEGELAGLPDATAELAQRPRLISLAHHADLLSEEMDLVFTKKTFSRASATAKRYRELPDCQTELARVHHDNWPATPAREPRFVYAMETKPGALPFFSKVNLLHHVTRIRAQGFEVAVARHPLPAFALPEPRSEGLPLREID
jgi:hypothetical protein